MANFLRYYLKNIILALVFIVALIVVGMQNINNTADIEAKKSSYTRTQFDYFISSPDKNQVTKIESDPSVDKVFPYYALSNAFTSSSAAKEIYLLLSDDMGDSGISLITEKTCVSGEYNKNGVMMDMLAAEKLGVDVGDTVTFKILNKSFTRTVSALYLTSTYGTLTKGIVLADFSDDIRQVYNPAAYGGAFITANDKSGVQSLLSDYVGEGNVALSFEEYVAQNCGTKPPYQTQEEYEAECQHKYQQYRDDIIASALRGGAQVAAKEDSYSLLKDRIETTEKGINNLNLSIAAASFVLFIILNIVFVVTNRRNDLLRCDEGTRFGSMVLSYSMITAVTAIVVAALTFGILYVMAAQTFFASECLKTILFFSLPVIISVPLVIVFVFLYFMKMYSNSATI